MKKNFKYLVFFLLFCNLNEKIFSQVSFSIDSLKISNVIWLCQNDVVIEDFAYGPHFDIVFSIGNCSKDTISICSKDIGVYIDNKAKRSDRRQFVFTNISAKDSIVVLSPDSVFAFGGYTDWVITGDITTGLNYRLVNFLPQIEKMFDNLKVTLEIPGFEKVYATFNNCYLEKTFFIDGTNNESIFDGKY